MGICPRGCVESVIIQKGKKKGKKKTIQSKPVEMKEGMILDTCTKCGFQCRAYDRTINEPQPHTVYPQQPFMVR